MAYAFYQYVNIGVKQEEYIEKAESSAKKALVLDADCAQAYFVLGEIYSSFRGNQQEAIRQYKKALAVSPNYWTAWRALASTYSHVGRSAMAFSLMERLREVDPLDVMNSNPQVYLLDGKYELALEVSRRMYEADPESPIAQAAYALALAYNKKFKEAILIIDKAAEVTPDNAVTKLVLLLKYGLLKDDEKAFLLLTSDFYKTCRRDLLWSYFVATDLSLLGAREEALDWLENAIKRGFINYPFLQYDPFLDNIRGEERFKKLMEFVKYEWEHFEVPE